MEDLPAALGDWANSCGSSCNVKLSPLYLEAADVNIALRCLWSKPRGGGTLAKEREALCAEVMASRETMLLQGSCYGNLWAYPSITRLLQSFFSLSTAVNFFSCQNTVEELSTNHCEQQQHSQYRRTQLEAILLHTNVLEVLCCGEVWELYICSITPASSQGCFTAKTLQLLFSEGLKALGPPGNRREKSKMPRNSSALGQARRSCERGERRVHFSIPRTWTSAGFSLNLLHPLPWAWQERVDFLIAFVFFSGQGCETQRGERQRQGFCSLSKREGYRVENTS